MYCNGACQYLNERKRKCELTGEKLACLKQTGSVSFTVYEHTELIDFSKVKIDDLIKELIQDIESGLIEWSMFYCDCWHDEEEIKVNRELIRNLICQLKEYL